MNMENKISIIVPCFNVEHVVSRCIESLLKQTISVNIILVNDGSTDRTLLILDEYAGKYDNIEIITKENNGLPQARKTGVDYAKTDYIGFVDADDWVEPEMYENLYRQIMQSKCQIACCNFFYSDEKGHTTPGWEDGEEMYEVSSTEAMHLIHMRKSVFPFMWNKLFHRDLLAKAAFPNGNFVGEDYTTLLPVLRKCDRISICNRPYYNYWQKTGSMSKKGFTADSERAFLNYHRIEKSSRKKQANFHNDVCCYVGVEYMAMLVSMMRNKRYDKTIEKYVKAFLRHSIRTILSSEMSMVYKTSAITCVMSIKLMRLMYRLYERFSIGE